MPADLARKLNDARLVIIKGDANYRRAVGDCLWEAHTPFSHALEYLDAPALCLRALKSDPVVGLPSAHTAKALDRIDPDWRVNGKRGLIQFKGQTSKSQPSGGGGIIALQPSQDFLWQQPKQQRVRFVQFRDPKSYFSIYRWLIRSSSAAETCPSTSSPSMMTVSSPLSRCTTTRLSPRDIPCLRRTLVRAKIQLAIDPSSPYWRAVRAAIGAYAAYPIVSRLMHLPVNPLPSQHAIDFVRA